MESLLEFLNHKNRVRGAWCGAGQTKLHFLPVTKCTISSSCRGLSFFRTRRTTLFWKASPTKSIATIASTTRLLPPETYQSEWHNSHVATLHKKLFVSLRHSKLFNATLIHLPRLGHMQSLELKEQVQAQLNREVIEMHSCISILALLVMVRR